MATSMLAPFRLLPFFSPRPWGTLNLHPWYDFAPAEPIGEAWLTGPQCRVEEGPYAGKTLAEVSAMAPAELNGAAGSPEYPLLLKILFPHDKLSVQVHPDDTLANAVGQPRGKTECWYVLEAAPGASVALGLKEGVELGAVRGAVEQGTLEELLEAVPVTVGDMVFVDAGTVHAIGPGVILLETQQTSDITYRLYDYGRPRELHIDRAIEATRLRTAAGKVEPVERALGQRLIEQKYFLVDRLPLEAGKSFRSQRVTGVPHALVAIAGEAVLRVEGCPSVVLRLGQAVVVPACVSRYEIHATEAATLIRSMPPAAA